MLIFPFVIFLVILTYYIRKNTRSEKELQAQFWQKENQANTTRRKDISRLDYVEIPANILTPPVTEDDEIAACYNTLSALSKQKILNLNNLTNTQLKLTYGAANLSLLTSYDENYTTLICTLVKLGKKLIENSLFEEAVSILHFGVTCKSDITENYTLLASLYKKLGRDGDLTVLYTCVQMLPSAKKEHILKKLNQI